VLAEKAVPGVDGLRARGSGGVDDAIDHQVRLRGRRRADLHRLVGEEHECCGAVRLAVHRNRADAEVATPADDAQSDLSAIGDEDLGEHQSICRMGTRGPTTSPSLTCTALTVPARTAVTSFCIFMASRTATTWPRATVSPTATGILRIN